MNNKMTDEELNAQIDAILNGGSGNLNNQSNQNRGVFGQSYNQVNNSNINNNNNNMNNMYQNNQYANQNNYGQNNTNTNINNNPYQNQNVNTTGISTMNEIINNREMLNNNPNNNQNNNGQNYGQINQSSNVNTNNKNYTNMRIQSGVSTALNNVRKVMPKSVAKDPKYTENWLNVKTIANNIIYNNSGEMVTGIKIQPKNIFILDFSQMDNTLIGLMNFYNTIDYEFWLVVADRPVDIAMYQAELQLLFNKTQDQTLRKIIAQDMDKGELFANNNVVDTEYFILFKEKNMDNLNKKIRNLITGLASCGLTASQTSNDDLRMIIDNFLNGGRKFEAGGVMPL